MVKESELYRYRKTKTGYSREKILCSSHAFISRILTSNVNRTIKYKLLELICWIVKHKLSNIVLEKGYDNKKYGTYVVSMCDRCRVEVIFYEGVKND